MCLVWLYVVCSGARTFESNSVEEGCWDRNTSSFFVFKTLPFLHEPALQTSQHGLQFWGTSRPGSFPATTAPGIFRVRV